MSPSLTHLVIPEFPLSPKSPNLVNLVPEDLLYPNSAVLLISSCAWTVRIHFDHSCQSIWLTALSYSRLALVHIRSVSQVLSVARVGLHDWAPSLFPLLLNLPPPHTLSHYSRLWLGTEWHFANCGNNTKVYNHFRFKDFCPLGLTQCYPL